ncbi:hypothetical protein ABE042_17950 [Viridibacillus arvi]|uniref:hypothetical protein n=1 Tax=Viridibacillus arvi TaxID=263475 RepID=UPI003D2E6E92
MYEEVQRITVFCSLFLVIIVLSACGEAARNESDNNVDKGNNKESSESMKIGLSVSDLTLERVINLLVKKDGQTVK